MAIIILNKSKCKLCGKLLTANDDIIGLPSFTNDEKDPLYFFSDRGFHKACFLEHPLSESVLRRVQERDEGEQKQNY